MLKKIITLLLSLFYLSMSFSQEQGFIDNDTIISWSEDRKLKWEDFEGVIDSINYPKFSAVTTSEIHFSSNFLKNYDISKINVIVQFYKKKSWSCSNSLETLKHEQLHYDIMELFSRKMRKSFKEKNKNGVLEIEPYFEEYNLIFNDCAILQQSYDQQTEHGTIGLKQLEWQDRISKELKALDVYKYNAKTEDVEN